jgi:hypothetical protein
MAKLAQLAFALNHLHEVPHGEPHGPPSITAPTGPHDAHS